MGVTSRQQQTQRTLLDWLRVEYAIEKASNKLLAVTDLDSDTRERVKRVKPQIRPPARHHPLPQQVPKAVASQSSTGNSQPRPNLHRPVAQRLQLHPPLCINQMPLE